MATVRIVLRAFVVALFLNLLLFVVEQGGTSIPHLQERLVAVSAGYFFVFAGTILSAGSGKPVFGAAITLVPVLWLQAFTIETASPWLIPGISGLAIGAALHYLVNERSVWPTFSTNNHPPSGASPTSRPAGSIPSPSVPSPSPSPRNPESSGPHRPIPPSTTGRYDPPTMRE
jgi:hypothetical protein